MNLEWTPDKLKNVPRWFFDKVKNYTEEGRYTIKIGKFTRLRIKDIDAYKFLCYCNKLRMNSYQFYNYDFDELVKRFLECEIKKVKTKKNKKKYPVEVQIEKTGLIYSKEEYGYIPECLFNKIRLHATMYPTFNYLELLDWIKFECDKSYEELAKSSAVSINKYKRFYKNIEKMVSRY